MERVSKLEDFPLAGSQQFVDMQIGAKDPETGEPLLRGVDGEPLVVKMRHPQPWTVVRVMRHCTGKAFETEESFNVGAEAVVECAVEPTITLERFRTLTLPVQLGLLTAVLQLCNEGDEEVAQVESFPGQRDGGGAGATGAVVSGLVHSESGVAVEAPAVESLASSVVPISD